MDDDERITNNYHFASDLFLPFVILAALISAPLVVLFILARKGDVVAISILVVLAAVVLILLGVGISLLIMGRVHRHEERRAQAEQARFRDNVRENLATIEAQARAQLAQARVQDQQWRVMRQEIDTTHRLAAPDNSTEGGFIFDETLFSQLDEVE